MKGDDPLLMLVIGIGSLLCRRYLLPHYIEWLSEFQYRLHRRLFGERYAQRIRRQYAAGLRAGFLIAGWAFIIFGLVRLSGLVTLP